LDAFLPWIIATGATIITSLVTALGITYRGQIKALTDENKFLRSLLFEYAGVSKRQTTIADRAVTQTEVRARLLDALLQGKGDD
jgi:hypothetical protein